MLCQLALSLVAVEPDEAVDQVSVSNGANRASGLTILSFRVLTFQNRYLSLCLPLGPRYFHSHVGFP